MSSNAELKKAIIFNAYNNSVLKIYFSSGDDVIFTEIFENNFSKIICLAVSITEEVIAIPFLYWIHKFERDNPYRVLHNQLLTLMLLTAITYNITGECWDHSNAADECRGQRADCIFH